MDVTLLAVESRLVQLRAGRERLHRDMLVTDGAIQDCEHWLEVLATPAPSEAVEAKDELAPEEAH